MHVMITTPVANFNIDHLVGRFAAGRFPIESWVRSYSKSYPEHRVSMWASPTGRLLFDAGPTDLIPAIWTHTPIPQGMDIAKLNAQFEKGAARVLGDYDSTPCFRVCGPNDGGVYQDNRYYSEGIRMAWMMYVDQAVQNFLGSMH